MASLYKFILPAIISLLILYLVPVSLTAQNRQHFDTVFVNRVAKEFFDKNSVVTKVVANFGNNGSKSLMVYPKSIWIDSSDKKYFYNDFERFNFNFQGDIHRFNKKYSYLCFPEEEINVVQNRRCNNFSNLHVEMYRDSIRCSLEYYCQSLDSTAENSDEEIVFFKVDLNAHYKPGNAKLKEDLEKAYKTNFKNNSQSPFDSVAIFKVLLYAKDSSLKRIELVEGKYSDFVLFFMNQLKGKRPWVPSIQGGRYVNSYFEIFIRLNKNGSITADIAGN